MGFCTRRHFLLSICTLQLLLTIQRQVFDFLGYMWAPILTNFFHILFVIFGFFGAYQYRIKYLLSYSIWNVIWLGWNIFVICFYLNVGVLDRDTSGILNLGTGSVSWFEANGYGCKPSYSTNHTEPDPFKPPRPEQPVPGCLLDYTIVEIIQAGQQCLLAILGVIGAICIGSIFMDEDDSFEFMGVDAKSPQHTAVHPMYVSYTSLPTTTTLSNASTKIVSPIHNNSFTTASNNNNNNNSPLLLHQHHITDIILKSALANSSDKLSKIKSASVTNSPNFSNSSLVSAHKYHSYQQYASPHTNLGSAGNLQRNLSFNLKRNGLGYTEVVHNSPKAGLDSYINVQKSSKKYTNHIIDRSPSPPPVPPRNSSQQRLFNGIENPFETSPFLNNSQSPLQSLNAINENGPYMEPHNVRHPAPRRNGQFSPSNASPQHSLVARSPNLNRINARRRLEGGNGSGSRGQGVNFCDQVRSPTRPLPFIDNNGYAEPYAMHRVKSQDRIVHRQRRVHRTRAGEQQRPRSYCSTNNNQAGNLKKSKYRQSLYSVEFGPPVDTIRSRSRDALNNAPETLSPKPMTPRRIKRRSVMNRGTTNRTSTQSRRSHHSRSSHRSSRRKVHQSPVTKLLEQQQGGASTSAAGKNLPSFSRGAAGTSTSTSHLTESNLKSLNNDYGPVPGTSRTASDIVRHSPDPIYYNMTHNVSSPLPQDTSWSPSPPPGHYSTATTLSNQGGHSNPTYQHSTPNLSHSPEPMDEPYSNRPPSVRSSYSNFHGARPLSSYNPQTGTKENVFLGLTQHQQQQQVVQNPQPPPVVHAKPETHPIQATHKHEPFRPTKPAAIPPPTHPKPYAHVQPQAQMPPPQSPSPYQHLPQLPQKSRMAMASSRESMSSIAFINSGPPAYNLNYHTPPDSETTM